MTTWVPKTTTWLIIEIQRLAKTYLWKKYTRAEIESKYDLGVKQYKLQCKTIWKSPDKGLCRQRWNKVLYAILESVKKEIRKNEKGLEQTSLW